MDDRIVRAMRLLEAQSTEEADHEAVARAVGLSRHRLHHLFVEATGETPGGYLRRHRLDLAAMRLRWTSETAGEIANGLGYASQSSFNRAFADRFGTTPARFRADRIRWPLTADAPGDRRIVVRHNDGLDCFYRRYLGPYSEVPAHWADFLARLPNGLETHGTALYLGLTYDDPRFTPASQIRYDCCVALARAPVSTPPGGLLHQITRAGLYASIAHEGDYVATIGDTYSLILDHWAANSTRYIMADDAAIEVYSQPPGQGAGPLRATVMVPLI